MSTAPIHQPPNDVELLEECARATDELRRQVARVIVGQDEVVDACLVTLLCRGHALLVGVPGLAKTFLVAALARALSLSFGRVQFTPDLLPADITGTDVLSELELEGRVRREVRFMPGPIFANLVLADEINRTPPKTQAALLQAMQERQVTVGGVTHPLPDPFQVFATRNPIEQEGTYPLPEAQVDRFMLKVVVDYPRPDEERLIIERMTGNPLPPVTPVVGPEQILHARDIVRRVYVDEKIKNYVLDLVLTTRNPGNNGLSDLRPFIAYGASPRAGINLILAARAHAFVKGRGFVTPDDVKEVAPDVLRHRIIVSYEAEAESVSSADIVQRILDYAEVP